MQREIYSFTFIDKSSWPRGEWDNEPDLLRFTDSLADKIGAFYEIRRNKKSGHLLGYLYIDKNLYYDCGLDVYGGVTACYEVIGFDCAHGLDFCPGYQDRHDIGSHIYRNLKFVKSQLRNVAKQFHKKFKPDVDNF